MKNGLLLAVVAVVLVSRLAAAAPGDQHVVEGVIVWPSAAANSPFLLIQGPEGRVYYADLSAVGPGAGREFKAGDRVTITGRQGLRTHEIEASSIVALHTLRGRLVWPRVLGEEPTIVVNDEDGQAYGVAITSTTRVQKGLRAGTLLSVSGYTGEAPDRLIAISIQPLQVGATPPAATPPSLRDDRQRKDGVVRSPASPVLHVPILKFPNPYDPTGTLGIAPGIYNVETGIATVTLPGGGQQTGPLSSWALAYDPLTRRVISRNVTPSSHDDPPGSDR